MRCDYEVGQEARRKGERGEGKERVDWKGIKGRETVKGGLEEGRKRSIKKKGLELRQKSKWNKRSVYNKNKLKNKGARKGSL